MLGPRRPGDAVAEEDLLDYERVPIPFALLEDASGTRTTLRQVAVSRPQLLIFLSSSSWACESIAVQMPEWTSRLGPVEISSVVTEPLNGLPAKVLPDGVPARFDVERGATDTFAPVGRPAAVLLGADGALAGGPVTGSDAVIAFVEDIVAELSLVGDLPMQVEPVHAAIGAHGHGHDGTSDAGHGHA